MAEARPGLDGLIAILGDQHLAIEEWVLVEAMWPSPRTNAVYYLVCNSDLSRTCREGLFEPGGDAVVRTVPDRGIEWWKSSAWSPTGQEIAYGITRLRSDGRRIAAVRGLDPLTGDVRDLAEFDDYENPSALAWSPDGRHLVVALRRYEAGSVQSAGAIAVIEVETGAHHFVTERPDDRFLAVSWRP